ncbi:MAG: hypothetical protein K9K79_10905, partial [Desulfohalobiaceae bacterium]|nr:hypothetical protein [Desulfohalobiaceae bacterium]
MTKKKGPKPSPRRSSIADEIITEEEFNCISPSGYLGRSGELWFARIFSEPFPEWSLGYSVV